MNKWEVDEHKQWNGMEWNGMKGEIEKLTLLSALARQKQKL